MCKKRKVNKSAYILGQTTKERKLDTQRKKDCEKQTDSSRIRNFKERVSKRTSCWARRGKNCKYIYKNESEENKINLPHLIPAKQK